MFRLALHWRLDADSMPVASPSLGAAVTAGRIDVASAKTGIATARSRKDASVPITLLYLVTFAMVLALTIQRSFFPHPHWTFWIFRSSFWHLVHGQNVYARYGTNDLFKYSPTFAVLFAPFAVPPFAVGMLLWNAFNVGALIIAFRRLFPRRLAALALLLVLPELFNSTQASQSNALVAALVLLAFDALERDRALPAFLAITLGTAIKLFPIAALSLAIFYPCRRRGAAAFVLCASALILLPLTIVSPATLQAQYGWWLDVEMHDAVARGASVMRVLHDTFGVTWPNWPVQLAGIILLLAPLLHRARWSDIRFRRTFLASLLVFVVIFNHQAERPSFIIAAAGVAVWFVWSPRDQLRLALVLLSLMGLSAWGYIPVWLVLQAELHGASLPVRQLWSAESRDTWERFRQRWARAQADPPHTALGAKRLDG
jgi:hypothetical protein